MKSKMFLFLLCTLVMAGSVKAQAQDVKVTQNGMSTTMDNGLVKIVISTAGRITTMYKGTSTTNLMASNGVYFDYTAAANAGLDPSTVKVVKQNADYAEVLYSNTSADIQFQQGFIMRKGVSGVYVYVIANGTSKSSAVNLREARVCTRLGATFLNGYVDDTMNGTIPSNAAMATAEQEVNTIQDATYKLSDGSIYTKYNWANYIVRDSVHGLMNSAGVGVWNIPCSHEYVNGGPMRQELTVHATSKSPITIQMLQGEHFGASSQSYNDGEKKIYGPFLIYVNSGSRANMQADAKAMAHQQMEEWPFSWFENELYPLDRATVRGHLNVTTGQACDSVQMVLGEPGIDIYNQGKKYIYWALTDQNGDFAIKNVRKGNYTLYGYATKGDVTDELQMNNISVNDDEVNLGTVDWTPTKYENLLWQIGENNRMSDGYRYSDTLRNYGLWNLVPASLTYKIGESKPEKNWYYAQCRNGVWTVSFDLDKTYTGNATLTASLAGVTNKPKIAIGVNGSNKGNWSLSTNDAAVYRSAVLGGHHCVQTCTFPASALRQGLNSITLTMSGIGSNGGVLYDCLKLETGNVVVSGIADVEMNENSRVDIYTISGVKIGTYDSIESASLANGLYIYKRGHKSGKVLINN